MNVRLIIQKGFVALLAAMALSSCDMMTEDRDDCPVGLYVNFVYNYNIQQADMFKDHVGGLTLYVYDESDRLVATKFMGESQLRKYGSYLHFTEQELAPDHTYRLMAVAFQHDMLSTAGAKYRLTGNNNGDQRSQFFVTLDHQPAAASVRSGSPASAAPASAAPASAATRAITAVSNAAPLDTLWHTLTTVTTPADSMPKQLHPAMLIPAHCEYGLRADGSVSTNGQQTVTLVKDVPTYATLSLIRDTKHLSITLRAINENTADNMVVDTDYTVEIIDNNSQVDANNDLTNLTDTIVYTPYRQWTTEFVGTDMVVTEKSAHYDLMFNRLVYKNASVQNDRYAILNEDDVAKAANAVLLIRKQDTGEIIFGINLPYILSSCRTWVERSYHYQEYLDREYDYRLQFILKGGRIEEIRFYIGLDAHIIPWTMRQQNETF